MRRSERKALDQPDTFTQTVGGSFAQLQKSPKVLVTAAGVAVLALVLFMTLSSRQERLEAEAVSKLYYAQKAYEDEMNALFTIDGTDEEASTPSKDKDKKAAEAKRKKLEAEREKRMTEFKKAPVDKAFQESLPKFEKVIEEYPGTQASFEARIHVGNLLYERAEHQKSLDYFQNALAEAPNAFQKSFVEYALGNAREELKEWDQALTHYHRALNLSGDVLKGDLLLAIARVQELKKDNESAKKTYQRIIDEMAKSQYAEKAEVFKARIN